MRQVARPLLSVVRQGQAPAWVPGSRRAVRDQGRAEHRSGPARRSLRSATRPTKERRVSAAWPFLRTASCGPRPSVGRSERCGAGLVRRPLRRPKAGVRDAAPARWGGREVARWFSTPAAPAGAVRAALVRPMHRTEGARRRPGDEGPTFRSLGRVAASATQDAARRSAGSARRWALTRLDRTAAIGAAGTAMPAALASAVSAHSAPARRQRRFAWAAVPWIRHVPARPVPSPTAAMDHWTWPGDRRRSPAGRTLRQGRPWRLIAWARRYRAECHAWRAERSQREPPRHPRFRRFQHVFRSARPR